jgi:hypothetical protein
MADGLDGTGRSYGTAPRPASEPTPPAQRITPAQWGIIEGYDIQPQKSAKTMEAERINALSSLLNDLTSREAELRRYL